LVHEVLPLLLAELPSIRVVLVGSNPPPEVTALRGPNVIAPGWVADLDPVYAEARVVVAPLRYGAGVKGKIGEALSHGVPIVTTSVGVEGMSMTDGRDALIGESPSELAAAIVRVYKDEELWVSLRQNGLALVDELFGEGATRERVMSLLAAVAQSAEY
jgi:glycosyltransferase involved in cell wall biosynthesis